MGGVRWWWQSKYSLKLDNRHCAKITSLVSSFLQRFVKLSKLTLNYKFIATLKMCLPCKVMSINVVISFYSVDFRFIFIIN